MVWYTFGPNIVPVDYFTDRLQRMGLSGKLSRFYVKPGIIHVCGPDANVACVALQGMLGESFDVRVWSEKTDYVTCTIRREEPCTHCTRKNDVGVKTCWWCGEKP